MEFPGTVTLSEDTVQRVYFEAVQSLIHHGFRRFMFLTSHTGNQNVSRYIIDRVNQETTGIAVELKDPGAPIFKSPTRPEVKQFDRHAGVGETSRGFVLVSESGGHEQSWQERSESSRSSGEGSPAGDRGG